MDPITLDSITLLAIVIVAGAVGFLLGWYVNSED